MNPYLNKENNPYIKIDVFISKWTTIGAIIDTGFAGGISLPKKYLRFFNNRIPLTIQRFVLADGSTKLYPIYEANVRYKGKVKSVYLVFSGEQALVGIEFLTGFKFVLDLKKFSVSLE